MFCIGAGSNSAKSGSRTQSEEYVRIKSIAAFGIHVGHMSCLWRFDGVCSLVCSASGVENRRAGFFGLFDRNYRHSAFCRWYDLRGPLEPCSAALVLLLVGWLGLGFAGEKISLMASAAFIGLGFGILMPSINAMLADLTPHTRRGAASATLLSSCDIGIAAGAMTFGWMIKHFEKYFDLSVIYRLSAVLIAASALLFWFLVHPHFQRNRLLQPERDEGQTLLPD